MLGGHSGVLPPSIEVTSPEAGNVKNVKIVKNIERRPKHRDAALFFNGYTHLAPPSVVPQPNRKIGVAQFFTAFTFFTVPFRFGVLDAQVEFGIRFSA